MAALAQPPAEAPAADAPDGRAIMERVEEYQRETSDSAFNRMQLSTCRFGVSEGRITCAERPRVKALESVGKNYGPEGLDSRSVTIVLEPADERGIGLLSYVYDDAERQNESWIYLSALGRIKRIASGNSDEESEAASLFGSEFTTEDTDTGKLEQYEIKVLEESVESGRDVWVIELIPDEERARETRYGRIVNYVDKERPCRSAFGPLRPLRQRDQAHACLEGGIARWSLDGPLGDDDEPGHQSLVQYGISRDLYRH